MVHNYIDMNREYENRWIKLSNELNYSGDLTDPRFAATLRFVVGAPNDYAIMLIKHKEQLNCI